MYVFNKKLPNPVGIFREKGLMDQIKIVSCNVNGLGDESKRRDIFRYIKQTKGHIFLLQETHSTVETEHLWKAEWGGSFIANHGTSAARGVATLIVKNAPVKVLNTILHAEGRWIITKLEIKGSIISLVNVYGPNEDNADFWTELFQVLEEIEDVEHIIAGDLNLTLDAVKDYGGATPNTAHSKKRAIVRDYTDVKGLQDVCVMLIPIGICLLGKKIALRFKPLD